MALQMRETQPGGDEQAFRQWYAGWARRLGLNADPDAPGQHYDYRAAWRAGAEPDASGHWPSEFKQAGHPREFIPSGQGLLNTVTGESVPISALEPEPAQGSLLRFERTLKREDLPQPQTARGPGLLTGEDLAGAPEQAGIGFGQYLGDLARGGARGIVRGTTEALEAAAAGINWLGGKSPSTSMEQFAQDPTVARVWPAPEDGSEIRQAAEQTGSFLDVTDLAPGGLIAGAVVGSLGSMGKAAAKAPLWRAKLPEMIAAKMGSVADADALIAQAKGWGVKQAELEASGLLDLAGRGRVAKQDVLDHLAARQIQVEEVVLGGPSQWPESEIEEEARRLLRAELLDRRDESWSNWWYDTVREEARVAWGDPSHQAWGAIGHGSGYYETLERDGFGDAFRMFRDDFVALDYEDIFPESVLDDAFDEAWNQYGRNYMDDVEGGVAEDYTRLLQNERTQYETYSLKNLRESQGTYRELLLRLPVEQPKVPWTGDWPVHADDVTQYAEALTEAERAAGYVEYRSPHWKDRKNVFAHVRFRDALDERGKTLLVIEEFQSDWVAKGRKQGWRQEITPEDLAMEIERLKTGDRFTVVNDARSRHDPPRYKVLDRTTGASGMRYTDTQAEAYELYARQVLEALRGDAAPPLPFAKNWEEIVQRRMLRWAADEGYDGIAWVPGRVQAHRYDLAQHVSMIEYDPRSRRLRAFSRDDAAGPPAVDQLAEPEEFDEYLGGEVGQRLRDEIERWEKHQEYERLQWTPEDQVREGETLIEGDVVEGVVVYDPNGEIAREHDGAVRQFDSFSHADDWIREQVYQGGYNESEDLIPTLSGLDISTGNVEGPVGFYGDPDTGKQGSMFRLFDKMSKQHGGRGTEITYLQTTDGDPLKVHAIYLDEFPNLVKAGKQPQYLWSMGPGLASVGVQPEYDEQGNLIGVRSATLDEMLDPERLALGLAAAAGAYSLLKVTKGKPVRDLAGRIKDWSFEPVRLWAQDIVPSSPVALKVSGQAAEDFTRHNPVARQVLAQYVDGLETGSPWSLAEFRQRFDGALYRDPETKQSLFDRVWAAEWGKRQKNLADPKAQPYVVSDIPVSGAKSGNKKTAGEVINLDTSQGCLHGCAECYAFGQALQGKICFATPSPATLTGHFRDAWQQNPGGIWRIGTSGEPGFNPEKWRQFEEAFVQMQKSGVPVTPEGLRAALGDSWDWSYTNEQMRKAGLDTRGRAADGTVGADRTYVITKLQSIEGFDPTVVRNLQVSIDPLVPEHYFTALENVRKLKEMDPTLNIWLRVRSMSTYSDEINTLQALAVDFANRHQIPILDTRVRVKGGAESMTRYLSQDDYWAGWRNVGNQQVDISKAFRPTPTQGPGKKIGTRNVVPFADVTPGGIQVREVTVQSDLSPRQRRARPAKESYDLVQTPAPGAAGPVLPLEEVIKTKTSAEEQAQAAGKRLRKRQRGATGDSDRVEIQRVEEDFEVVLGDGTVVETGLTKAEATSLASRIGAAEPGRSVPSPEALRRAVRESTPLSQLGLDENLHLVCDALNTGDCKTCGTCRTMVKSLMGAGVLGTPAR